MGGYDVASVVLRTAVGSIRTCDETKPQYISTPRMKASECSRQQILLGQVWSGLSVKFPLAVCAERAWPNRVDPSSPTLFHTSPDKFTQPLEILGQAYDS
jgi:hypothetical protein